MNAYMGTRTGLVPNESRPASHGTRLATIAAVQENASAHRRVISALLTFVIIAGSLALWTVVPVAWLSLTSSLAPGPQFVLVIFGLPLTMALTFMILSRTDAHRRRLSGRSEEDGPSLFEVMLVVSGVVALVALVVWWFFIANASDPSGPLQPI